MQMSGSVNPLQSFIDLKQMSPHKKAPMRIEMAVAAAPETTFVEEFPEPVSIIYGRSNSDRANYGKQARREDVHLAAWLTRYAMAHPDQAVNVSRALSTAGVSTVRAAFGSGDETKEEWRVRGLVAP
jgi:hypothetical protein